MINTKGNETDREAERLAWPIKEGAFKLGVGRSTIYKLAGAGKLRLIKIAGRRLIPHDELIRLLNGDATAPHKAARPNNPNRGGLGHDL